MKLEKYFPDDKTGLVNSANENLISGDEVIVMDRRYESQHTLHGFYAGLFYGDVPTDAEIINKGSIRNFILTDAISLPFAIEFQEHPSVKKDYTDLVEFFRNLKEERRKVMYSADVKIYKVCGENSNR